MDRDKAESESTIARLRMTAPARGLRADRYVEEHAKLVHWAVVRYSGIRDQNDPDYDDAFQIGLMALLECGKKYDSYFGVQPVTYLVKSLFRAMRKFRVNKGAYGFSRMGDFRSQGAGTMPRPAALEEWNGSTCDKAIRDASDGAQDVIDLIKRHLPHREAECVLRHYRGETLGQVGKKLGLSKERVRQIEGRAIDILRGVLGLPVEPKHLVLQPTRPPKQVRRCAYCKQVIPNSGCRKYCKPGQGCRSDDNST
jgi:RNA polymerase sigma factor (sigma-70 family)